MPRYPGFLVLALVLALPSAAALVPGPERQLTRPVLEPPAFSQRYGRIATDGRDFLAVWTENASATAAVHAARVSANGSRIDDAPLVVSDTERNDEQPDVAWGKGRYLVAWTTETGGIFARFVGPDLETPDPFRLTTNVYGAQPRVLWNGRVFLVMWRAFDGARGAILGSDGRVSADVFVPAAVAPAELEVVTANGSLFVVTSNADYAAPPMDPGPAADVVITRVQEDGRIAERTVVAPAEAFVSDLRAASSPGAAMVGWTSTANGTNTIRNVRLTALGAGPIESFDAGAMRLDAVIRDGTEFLVVYGDRETRLVRDAHGAAPLLIPSPPGSRVMAGASGAEGVVLAVVVMPEAPYGNPFGWGLYAQRLGRSDLEPLAVASRHQSAPHIAHSGDLRLAAWTELVDEGRRLTIVAARIGADGASLDQDGIDLGVSLRWTYKPLLRVAGGAGQWLVVWHDGDTLYGLRVAGSGGVLDPTPITIATQVYYSDPFSIAWDGSSYLVVFTRGVPTRPGGSFQVTGVRVGAGGAVESPELVISEYGPNAAPSIAMGTGGALVVWTSTYLTSLTYAVRGALVSPGGAVTPISFPSPERVAFRGAAVAWNGSTFLVAAPYGSAIRFFLVNGSGVVTEAPGTIPVPLPFTRLELESVGDRFLVAWGADGAIHGATINAEGFVADGDTILAAGSLYDRGLGLSGRTVVYARNTDTARARLTRVFVREVATVPSPPKRRSIR